VTKRFWDGRRLTNGCFVEGMERRLAAVLVADVAGYSLLMGADEVGTLAALKAHRREIADPARFDRAVFHFPQI
jgi:class 3 adenylate cyclase